VAKRKTTRKAQAVSSDLVMDEDKAAALLLLSVRTLQRFRVEGRGPTFVKLGKRVFYTETDLRAYVEASRHQSTSGPAA
jgi:helix-turn-helix protein